ncbi:hypothetical protein AAG570_007384 [Ranatra chinensis]|uniref:Uncharacterized protein n=1 Tax=Ranatra chinensis TaxID=642074 RepID=A0ABD0YE85_9HEMI
MEVTPAADATRTGVPMSEEAAALAKEFAAWTLASPQLPDMCSVDLASGYLQCLLPAIRSVDKALAQKLVKRLLDDCFAAGEEDREGGAEAPRLPKVFDSMPSKRLLETTIEVASSKRYKQLYGRLFEGRLATLSLDRNANFAVQKLLRRCREKDDFESMYAEISPKFMDIITVGNTGVVLAVGETCERLAAKQNDFIVSLAKAFDCWEPEPRQNHFAVCVLRMKPYGEVTKSAAVESGDNVEDNNRTKPSVNIHGSLIVQAMLRFKKPIKVINSLLSTDANELCDILCDPKGSHVVDNYTTSEYVGEKSRERLVNKLKGHYVRLACDRHGSRSFDSVWRRAGAGHRARIAAELSAREAAVTASEYGRIIASKVALNEFRHKREVWTRMVAEGGRSGPEKTKDMFKDIVAGLEIKAEV